MKKLFLTLILIGIFTVSANAGMSYNNILNQGEKVTFSLNGDELSGKILTIEWTELLSPTILDTITVSVKFFPSTENNSVEPKITHSFLDRLGDLNDDGVVDKADFFEALKLYLE